MFLFRCLSKFRLLPGLAIYFRIKILRSGKVFLPGLKHPIYFRSRSGDIGTFREIFLREEYAIRFPFSPTPQIIIDAGANIGFTTLYFAKQYPTTKIFSLEPDKENFEYLKKNTSGYKNLIPIQSALWNKVGTIEIKDNGYGVRGYMTEEGSSTESSASSIPSTTLEALIKENNVTTIDILKMDIEGSEKEVFSVGTEKWLPITKCLIIELHDRMKSGCSQAVFKALAHYNFECSIKGENLVFVNKSFNLPPQ
jgi:FkbM family methyltransferase